MKNHRLLFAAILSISFTNMMVLAQNYQWAKNFGSASEACAGEGVGFDANGNIYVAGSFGGTVDFDPGAGTANLIAAGSSGDRDIYIAKYDALGNYVWAKRIGATNFDEAAALVVRGGTVCITGSFRGTVDFDPGVGTATLVSGSLANDIYFARYDLNGNYLVAKAVGGSSLETSWAVDADANGNTYIAGDFQGTADFDPGIGTANLTASGGDVFFAKYDATGNYVWAHQINADYARGIRVDASGNVFVTGQFSGTVDFDPGTTTVNMISAGQSDIYLAKYSSGGVYQWSKSMGSTGLDGAHALTMDLSGNIYVTGRFIGTVDFDPGVGTATVTSAGNYDIFLGKYDAAGNYIWAKGMGGTSADIANGVSADAGGNPHIIGYYQGTADFDPGSSTANLVSTGSYDICFAAYTSAGNYISAKSIGSTGWDSGYDIANDMSGNIVITGYFVGTADFDPSSATVNLNLMGAQDMFLAKYNSCNVHLIVSNNPVCAGSPVTLSTTATSNISWSTGGSSPSVVVTPTATTSYSVSGSATSGTATCTSSLLITVSVNPVPTLVVNASPSVICSGGSATLAASGASSYSWNSIAGSGTMTVILNNTGPNNFTLTGANSNGCLKQSTVSVNVVNCVGLEDQELLTNFYIYPNPNTGKCTINYSGSPGAELEVYSAFGQLILKQSLLSNEIQLDLEKEAPGLYLMHVKTVDGTNKVYRLVKSD